MKNPRTAWTVYIVLRLVFFAAPFAVFFLLGIKPWLAAIFAALIGVSLSIILLSKPRDTASESIYDWRHRGRTDDSILEDEAVDAAAPGAERAGELAEAGEPGAEPSAESAGEAVEPADAGEAVEPEATQAKPTQQ
ncbi:DUF4229 domain-containing protein [Leucobacter chromiireducens]|uniref:DUF4229 domain-containing protein n=1 Tax=Leucobacter chromiireducens TaxID=283877 RepID=UPI0013DE64BE|nr:DUF4229 domain-containing protein [Leucobacter chromiireducens]